MRRPTLKAALPLSLAALLFAALFPAAPLLSAREGELPVLALKRPELAGADLPDAAALFGALLAAWGELYADEAALIPGRFAPAGSMPVTIVIQRRGAALRAEIRVAAPDGGPEELSTLRFTSHGSDGSGGAESLPSALAGGIFRLYARLTDRDPQPRSPPPLPAGILDLGALSLLPGGAAEPGEPVDLAASPGGPLLVFGRGILRLGTRLEITRDTLRDLTLAPPLPPGVRIGAAFLGGLSSGFGGEPRLVDPDGGSLFYADPGGVRRLETGLVRPEDTTPLPGGGFAVLKGRTLAIFRRVGERLRSRAVELPAGLYSALAADRENRIWVYDLGERRFRIFSSRGRETGSVTPLLGPGELQFPQTCAPLSDGAFLLGGGGSLFCFEADGLPRWKLDSVPARLREALPAYFRVVPTPEEDGFYLLDAPRNRLLLFRYPDTLREGTPEAAWAAAFPGFDGADPEGLLAARAFLIDNRLLLQAFLPTALLGDPGKMESLARLASARSAELSAGLAEELESQLLLPEAETALKAGLELYHGLRRDDPVDPRWPAAIAELSARRSRLRDTLLAEPLLEIDLRSARLAAGPDPDGGPRLLAEIAVRNSGSRPLRALRLEARLAGLSAPVVLHAAGRLEGGGTLVRSLALPLSAGLGAETRLCRLAVRVSYAPEQGAARSQYAAFPLPLPQVRRESRRPGP